ncbi:LOW QUALITY PROTEIN: kelch-like protein 28 [Aquarana catesbeiana]|uniref:LOW QUALITY PROTEIN: kelch-like protein 28 n=1 Tax=Aquarana catesbeiana TaxID=8400 RepID=UPI003CC94B4E
MDQSSQSYMLANITHLHSEQLLQGLNLLRQHHELCDIVLQVGDVKIHAHKVVLASISPYFKAMFTGNLSEKENTQVEFQCVDEAALQAIIEYAYTGTVFISQETVESLLPAANLLQIKLVLKECCAFLESQLDVGNCIGISRFAETYGCHELYLAANKFICQNFEDVSQTEEFFELTNSELHEIVSNDCLNVVSEESVFYALEAWIKYDVQERQKFLSQLLHCVRLPLLSVKFLTRLYEANHLIRDDHTCKHLLNEALKYHFMPEHRLSHQTVLKTQPRCAPKVLCAVGGKAGLFTCLESMEMYFPQDDSWIGLAPLSMPRYEFGLCTLDQKVYVVGGIATTAGGIVTHMRQALQSKKLSPCVYLANKNGYPFVERYDPAKDSWEMVAPMADKRINFGVSVMLGFIFVVGGHNGVSHLSSIERYDPHQNQWTVCRPMTEPRTGVGAAVIDNYLYVVGGHSGATYLNTVQKYDPISDTWSDSAGMAYSRCNFGLTAL